MTEARGREWSAFLMTMAKYLKEYDIFCMIHDKKSSQMFYESVGRTFCDILWANVLDSREYIDGVLSLFDSNPEIGLLIPPEVYHGTFFDTAIDFWTICFDETVKLSQKLNLKVPFDKDKPPISIGSVFWCRSAALDNLLLHTFSFSDFPKEPMDVDGTFSHALERILPFVAQSQGYYTATIMNSKYAAVDIANKQFIIRNILKYLKSKTCVATLQTTLGFLKREVRNE